ncbi:hypothetical protein BDN67DRAFT_537849 [Paxillus ammoniavirescens]|nr:hypothetical protein BDN67DRAFT_537849 [Paxillus ammoniavirescens]
MQILNSTELQIDTEGSLNEIQKYRPPPLAHAGTGKITSRQRHTGQRNITGTRERGITMQAYVGQVV